MCPEPEPDPDPIIVTGHRFVDWGEYLSFRTPRSVDDGSGTGEDQRQPGDYDCSAHPPIANYPEDFDLAKDAEADEIAKQAAAEIQAQANFSSIEYAVMIWQDSGGALHRTRVLTEDSPFRAYDPATTSPQSLGFDSWSQVVGIIHNHPTLHNTGNATNPNWVPQSVPYPSNPDLHALRWFVTEAGASAAMSRIYILSGSNLNEYYYFDQDFSKLRYDSEGKLIGGNAPDAQPSSDFHGEQGWSKDGC